jgi:Protein of unknown function (DUF3617)
LAALGARRPEERAMKKQLWLVIAMLACAVTLRAQTQAPGFTTPPVKMGLWQMTNTGTVTGLTLPPEVVARLQQMGKPVPTGQPHTMVTQSCLTADKWQKMFSDMQQDKDCHFLNQKQTATGLSTDLACQSSDGRTTSKGHVQVLFVSDEKMTGVAHVETTNSSQPQPIVMDMTFSSNYMGSDCKGVSPDSPKIVK